MHKEDCSAEVKQLLREYKRENIRFAKNKAIMLERVKATEQEIEKEFLRDLQDASWESVEYRNKWLIVLALHSKNKLIRQPMVPLRKSEYISPLLAN